MEKKMNQEIERKFLVAGDYKSHASESVRIVQGYLSSTPGRTVRVRIVGERAFLTVKGPGNASGTTHFEWEHPISVADAEALLPLCEKGTIDKTRYFVPYGGHTFEVDEFYGANNGLVIAEVELSDENEPFERPEWLGEEVTGDKRYYNAYLCRTPYTEW